MHRKRSDIFLFSIVSELRVMRIWVKSSYNTDNRTTWWTDGQDP